jgi:hypothetical protein
MASGTDVSSGLSLDQRLQPQPQDLTEHIGAVGLGQP